jgi:hypothetical protein
MPLYVGSLSLISLLSCEFLVVECLVVDVGVRIFDQRNPSSDVAVFSGVAPHKRWISTIGGRVVKVITESYTQLVTNNSEHKSPSSSDFTVHGWCDMDWFDDSDSFHASSFVEYDSNGIISNVIWSGTEDAASRLALPAWISQSEGDTLRLSI